jgi:hypothetical protein
MDFETRYPQKQCVKAQMKAEKNSNLTKDFMIESK